MNRKNQQQQRSTGGGTSCGANVRNKNKNNYCFGCHHRGHRQMDCPNNNRHIAAENNNNNNHKDDEIIIMKTQQQQQKQKQKQQQALEQHEEEIILEALDNNNVEENKEEVVEQNELNEGVTKSNYHQQHEEVQQSNLITSNSTNHNRNNRSSSDKSNNNDNDTVLLMTMIEKMIRTTIHDEILQFVTPSISRIVQQEISKSNSNNNNNNNMTATTSCRHFHNINNNNDIIYNDNNISSNNITTDHIIIPNHDCYYDDIIISDIKENHKMNTTTTITPDNIDINNDDNCNYDYNDDNLSMMMMMRPLPRLSLPPAQQQQQQQHDNMDDNEDDNTSVIFLSQQHTTNEYKDLNQYKEQQLYHTINNDSDEACTNNSNNDDDNNHIIKLKMMLDRDKNDRLWDDDDSIDNDTAVIMSQQQHTNEDKVPQDINEEKSHQVSLLSDIIIPMPNDDDKDHNDTSIIQQQQHQILAPQNLQVPPQSLQEVQSSTLPLRSSKSRTRQTKNQFQRKCIDDISCLISTIAKQRKQHTNNDMTIVSKICKNYYLEGKKYTERFILGLKKLVPGLKDIIPNDVYDNIFQKRMDGNNNCIEIYKYWVSHIFNYRLTVPKSLLHDLDNAIFFRTLVSSIYHDQDYINHHNLNHTVDDQKERNRNNSQHVHFIYILEYCLSKLKALPTYDDLDSYVDPSEFVFYVMDSDGRIHEENPTSDIVNNEKSDYTIIIRNHDNLDEKNEHDLNRNNTENSVSTGRIHHPVIKLTMPDNESVMKDQSDCMVFLQTIEDMMHSIAQKYVTIRQNISDPNIQITCHDIANLLIDAAVYVNETIRNVVDLEKTFVLKHPHLNTIYLFFIRLVYSDQVKDFIKLMSQISPLFINTSTNQQQLTEKLTMEFFASLLECAIREGIPNNEDYNDKENRRSSILINDFINYWKITDKKQIYNIFHSFQDDVVEEVVLTPFEMKRCHILEIQKYARRDMQKQNMSVSKPSGFNLWYRYSFIGCPRPILKTIRCLETISYLKTKTASTTSHDNVRFTIEAELYGTSWESVSTDYYRVPYCIDDLLMSDIMPTLMNMCLEGFLSSFLSNDLFLYEQKLVIMLQQIKEYAQYPNRPVTWSMTLTVHAILTSIFEMYDNDNQNGDQNRYFPGRVSRSACSAFRQYCDQIELPKEDNNNNNNIPILQHYNESQQNISKPSSYRSLVDVPMKDSILKKSINHAVWNPLCAGTFLCYVKNILEQKIKEQ